MGQQSSACAITDALNLGGPSRLVESKSRWPGGQIGWPRPNSPVLTTSPSCVVRTDSKANMDAISQIANF